jgi:hypothetical protein
MSKPSQRGLNPTFEGLDARIVPSHASRMPAELRSPAIAHPPAHFIAKPTPAGWAAVMAASRARAAAPVLPAPVVPAPVDPAPVVTPPAPPIVVALAGTMEVSGAVADNRVTISGSGTLDPIGRATLSLSMPINDVESTPAAINVATPRGNLILRAARPVQAIATQTIFYTIAAGSGDFAGATGSGRIAATLLQLQGYRGTVMLRFS